MCRLWETKAGEPAKQQCLVSKGRLQSNVEWNLWDWAGNGGVMGETQRYVVSWHVRKCRARGGQVKTATRSFSPAKQIDCAAVELQKVPRKVLSEGRI